MDVGPVKKSSAPLASAPAQGARSAAGVSVLAGDSMALARTGGSRRPNWSPDNFVLGANMPWLNYGCDFGANAWQPQGGLATPARKAQLEAVMTKLQAQGIDHVRWWTLSDGRAGVKFAPDGTPTGLDDHFFADMDAALDAARRHGIKITFSLLDFGWCKPGEMSSGVQVAGHADTIADPRKRQALINNVIKPIVARYGNDPAVEAWEVMNEPEWMTRWLLCLPWKGVPKSAMHDFLADAVKAIHANASQPVTVGLASTRGLSFAKDLGLDFYEVHWYDYMERVSPLEKPADKFKLDAPLVLGEFPTKATQRSTSDILDTVRKAGYAGGFAWSIGATDAYTDGNRAEQDLKAWGQQHADKLAH